MQSAENLKGDGEHDLLAVEKSTTGLLRRDLPHINTRLASCGAAIASNDHGKDESLSPTERWHTSGFFEFSLSSDMGRGLVQFRADQIHRKLSRLLRTSTELPIDILRRTLK